MMQCRLPNAPEMLGSELPPICEIERQRSPREPVQIYATSICARRENLLYSKRLGPGLRCVGMLHVQAKIRGESALEELVRFAMELPCALLVVLLQRVKPM